MVKIELDYFINTTKASIPEITAIILYLLYNKEDKSLEKYLVNTGIDNTMYETVIKFSEESGLLKIVGENSKTDIEFRKDFVSLLPQSEINVEIQKLTEEYLELWPKGVKSMGRYVRASEEDITNLLDKFLRKYKKQKFTKDTILEATKKYIEEKRKVNWSYITCSDYFISKNNVSMLAGYCTNLGTKQISDKKDYEEAI